jgi:hypothetical protein
MAGVTAAGFDRKLEADILDEMGAEARATIDPTFDTSADSVGGQLIGIVGSKVAELWEVLEAVYGALSENASGVSLDRIAAITGTVRKLGETDAQLRIRRRQELADAGQTTEAAIRAALSKLPGVVGVRIFSNRSSVAQAVLPLGAGLGTRPPHSVEAVVLGGADADVANTVWQNLPAGIASAGGTSVGVTDEEGNPQTVLFSRPVPVNLWVRVTVQVAAASYAGTPVLQQTLSDFTSGERTLELSDGSAIEGAVPVGGVVYRSRLSAAALTVPGVIAVRRVELSTTGTTWTDEDLALGDRAYLGLAADNRGLQPDHVLVVLQ